MIKNYLKAALRNLWKQKRYFIINLFGLVLGSTASLGILTYINHQLSYDRFHENKDWISRGSEFCSNY